MKKPDLNTNHQNTAYSTSFLTTTVINMLAMSTTIGLTMQIEVDSIEGFILFVVGFTLLDTMVSLLLKRYFFKWVIQSFGLIYGLAGFLVIFIIEQLVPDMTFKTVFGLVGFSIFFLALRLLLKITFERFTKRQNERI